ncbi:MAG: hypothetical protein QOH03_5473 [Kribbellaceae bacterium]|nr:hypothetical protein [Kribbellaceae bacterium]
MRAFKMDKVDTIDGGRGTPRKVTKLWDLAKFFIVIFRPHERATSDERERTMQRAGIEHSKN